MSDGPSPPDELPLSRRERQIMNVIYAHGEASVNQVLRNLPDPPGRTAVRTLLRILEEKGHLRHYQAGRQFIYQPTRPRKRAGISALRHVLDIFYNGSVEEAVAVHLADSGLELADEERMRLARLIDDAKARESDGAGP